MHHRDNVAYLRTHQLHVKIDKLVGALVEVRPSNYKIFILEHLKKQNLDDIDLSMSKSKNAGLAVKRIARQRSVTMLNNPENNLKANNIVVHSTNAEPSSGRKASVLRRSSQISVRDKVDPLPEQRRMSIANDVDDEPEIEHFFGCHCSPEQLLLNISTSVTDSENLSNVSFHKLFHSCGHPECGIRPAHLISLSTLSPRCRKHANELYLSDPTQRIWLGYDISIYERSYYCFHCSMHTSEATDPFDDFLCALYESKGTYVDDPIRDKEIEEHGNIIACTMQGWRSTQEDSHVIHTTPNGTVLTVVFDGHGGTVAAMWLADRFLNFFNDDLLDEFSSMDEQMIITTINTQYELLDSSLESNEGRECGTTGATCNMIILTTDSIICSNLGDSRSVLEQTNSTIELSNDHCLDSQIEIDRIISAGYCIRNNRIEGTLSVPRGFGDFDFKQNGGVPPSRQAVSVSPDITIRQRSADDLFIISACDGIWDGYDSKDATAHIKNNLITSSPTEAVKRLLDANLCPQINEEAIGTDNQTCIYIPLQ